MAGALSVQIATNLANDYFDFKKGTDSKERIGPVRVTQSGLIKPSIVLLASLFLFAVTAYIAYLLYQRGGQPIAIIGIASILSGILYTAGPLALGYLGLGDFFVLIFFGPVAVAGTYYVQSLEINMAVILSGLGPGLISVAILTINNLRDIDTDRKSNKRTLAVRFGRSFALNEFLFCILTASLLPSFIYFLIEDHIAILATNLTVLLSIPVIKTVLTKIDGPSLNNALAYTGRLLLVYSLLFSIGWIL